METRISNQDNRCYNKNKEIYVCILTALCSIFSHLIRIGCTEFAIAKHSLANIGYRPGVCHG